MSAIPSSFPVPRSSCGAVAAAVLVLVAGCATERVVTSDGRPLPPEPRRVGAAPAGLVPARMTLIVAPRPSDDDGDGWPDTVHATAAFFSPEHPLSIETGGVLELVLWRMGEAGEPGAEPLGRWSVPLDGDAVTPSRALYGPCYRIALDLDPIDAERIPATSADLRAAWTTATGAEGDPTAPRVPASSDVRPVQLGRDG